MITTILWDVDRTLLDFDAAERAAVQSLYIEFGLGECSEEALARYSATVSYTHLDVYKRQEEWR